MNSVSTTAPPITPTAVPTGAGSSLAMRSPPSLRTVINAQLFAIVRGIRDEAILFLSAFVFIGSISLYGAYRLRRGSLDLFGMINSNKELHEILLPYWVLILFALLLPLGVWRAEPPGRRAYHWSMPVSRHTHSVIKAFAGWCWLLVGLGICVLLSWIGGILYSLVFSGQANFIPDRSTIEWLRLLLGPSSVYLLMSALVIAAEHPWRWVFAGAIMYSLIMVTMIMSGDLDIGAALLKLYAGPYGLGTALWGTSALPSSVSIGGFKFTWTSSAVHSTSKNAITMILWTVIGIIAVYGAAYWRSRILPRSE